ncbi:MAG TPA: ABC transporter ATP-binding protein [Candidatus Binatia bacterium]|nr:ABC transporter ATP-binding protein [Candidatus Binatia bacterium]
MPGMLDYDCVTKDYGSSWSPARVRALDSFTLSLERGEICGFLGPNGAGKTTAIHLALGFMRPSSGCGRLLGKPFGHAATRARVGFLPENVALYHLPADRLLRFYGALSGLRPQRLRLRCSEVLRQVGLEMEARRNVAGFSRGMQQRIGLAQALINDPDLLILDEPGSGLDPLARVVMRDLLLEANGAGKTIFLSSHLLSEIEMICHRVAILHKGRLIRVGRTDELLTSRDRYHIVARGVPANRFEQAQAHDGRVEFTVAAALQRDTLERIWALGGEVLSVNPVRRTLEEVFVELTGEGADR